MARLELEHAQGWISGLRVNSHPHPDEARPPFSPRASSPPSRRVLHPSAPTPFATTAPGTPQIIPKDEFLEGRPSSPVSRGSVHAGFNRATMNSPDANSVQGSVATYRSSTVAQKVSVPGVPVDRQTLVSSAIRLYHTTTGGEYELEDVRDVIAEVMRWGEALITYDVTVDKELLTQLVRNKDEIKHLRNTADDKEEALAQLRASNEVLKKYVGQLEARLEMFDLYQPDDENTATDGATNGGMATKGGESKGLKALFNGDGFTAKLPTAKDLTAMTHIATRAGKKNGSSVADGRASNSNGQMAPSDSSESLALLSQLSLDSLLGSAKGESGTAVPPPPPPPPMSAPGMVPHLAPAPRQIQTAPPPPHNSAATSTGACRPMPTNAKTESAQRIQQRLMAAATAMANSQEELHKAQREYEMKRAAADHGASAKGVGPRGLPPKDAIMVELAKATAAFEKAKASYEKAREGLAVLTARLSDLADAKDEDGPGALALASVAAAEAMAPPPPPPRGDTRGFGGDERATTAVDTASSLRPDFMMRNLSYDTIASSANTSRAASPAGSLTRMLSSGSLDRGDNSTSQPHDPRTGLPFSRSEQRIRQREAARATPTKGLSSNATPSGGASSSGGASRSSNNTSSGLTGVDPGLQVFTEVYNLLRTSEVVMDEDDVTRMDINKDGRVSGAELSKALTQLGTGLNLSAKKANALFGYLHRDCANEQGEQTAAGDSDSISVRELAAALKRPPKFPGHAHKSPGHVRTVSSGGRTSIHATFNLDEDGNVVTTGGDSGVLGDKLASQLATASTGGFGDTRSREVLQVKSQLEKGWDDKFHGVAASKHAITFGNVFEAQHKKAEPAPRRERRSSMARVQAPMNPHCEMVLKKIAKYCDSHGVNVWKDLEPFNKNDDGFVEGAEVKAVLNTFGVHITTGEALFVSKHFAKAKGRVRIHDIHDAICLHMH